MKRRKGLCIIRNNLGLLLTGSVLGLAALILVHYLPVAPIREHVYWSLDMIEKEFTDEVLVDGYKATLTGNFTDCLMLEHAVYASDHHGVLEQALLMYRAETCEKEDGWWPGYSLKDYLENTPQPREVSYARYWHGYLVLLKPLLMLTSFNTLRLFNSALQLILAGWGVMGFCKKGAYSLAKAFLISLPFLFFISTYASLSLSICYYIMVTAILLQLKLEDTLYEKRLYGYFFLILGMVTVYFDFLTYPLVTLAYPLCVYLYLHGEKLWTDIKKMAGYSLEWFVGYAGMWAAKWIFVELFTESSVIQDALETVRTRTYSAEGYNRLQGCFRVFLQNMQVYGNWCYALLGLGG